MEYWSINTFNTFVYDWKVLTIAVTGNAGAKIKSWAWPESWSCKKETSRWRCRHTLEGGPIPVTRVSMAGFDGVRLFARRTFTTPKIRTFTTPKFGHFPPPKTKHLPGGQLPPPIFFFFFWRTFLGFFDLQLMEDIKDGKEEVLDEVVMEHIK